MLSTIREKVQGWIAAIILGLIAIPFALWGINYYFEGGEISVAEVNGVDVRVDNYRRALDEQRRSFQQMLGRGADPRLFDTPEFRQRVLDGLIDEILLASDVVAAGYRVSDAELARQIREAQQFQREGRFDPKLYELLLRNVGQDARGFEARLRRDVQMRQAASGYAESVIVTTRDIETLLRLEGQQREAAYAVLPPARVRDKVRVNTQAIEQEYSAHTESYRTPERVRIEYIQLSAEGLARSIRLSDAELRQALDEAGRSGTSPEQRRASHILIKIDGKGDAAEKAAMARAQDLRAKLQAGADFAALARQHSADPGSAKQGGDLGFATRGTFAKEFDQALFAMAKTGQLSAPVRTEFGLHLIKLTGIKATALPAVNRTKIEADLKARKAEERFIELSERFHNLVYEHPDSLKPAAETLGLKIELSGWFTRAGSAQGISVNPKLVEAAFDPEVLGQGRNSAAIEVDRNTLVALRVASHEPPRQRPLSEVRTDIEKALLANARQAEAERLAQEALREIRAGTALDAVARKYGMDYRPAKLYGRKAAGADAPLIEALFKVAHPADGKPVSGNAVLADGSQAIFLLRRVVEPGMSPSGGAEGLAVRRALETRRGRDYFENYRSGLRDEARIKVYKDQL